MIILVVLFFVTALLYASVGFGGGSTYNALLVLHGADYRVLPAIALICNIIVVTGGVWRFSSSGHLNFSRLLPWMVASIPAAWLGGRLPISETVFIGALGGSLLVAGLQLVIDSRAQHPSLGTKPASMPAALIVGGSIGFLSGLVGIGGGIFLAPILYYLRWGTPQMIAGACSLFILVNSIAGLSGQFIKLGDMGAHTVLLDYWMLVPAVLIGGQIGSHLGATGLSPVTIKRLTAVLILYVAARLIFRWFNLVF